MYPCLRDHERASQVDVLTVLAQLFNFFTIWTSEASQMATRCSSGRMIKSQDQDEFVAVRVQDPRVQNEGSWNSYVDFKIFLHTNSKAFTAKTSCVRRRYSEFVWLRKKLQKNAGLVPVPDLPSKSFFSFNNEDFIERRRKGLQGFLDKVVHLTVCLSDSQLHLFLQTQLPVSHIQDCVMGLTPYTVTDAILTYASSNQGWAQAQEEEADTTQEQCPTVRYESMESPSPHAPSTQHGDHAPVPTPSQEDGDATADSVTVDVHQVNLVELTVKDTEEETQVDTAGDPSIEGQVETRVDLQPQGVDLEIVNPVNTVKEEEEKAEVTKRAEENRTAVEQLLAVDQVEELLVEVGLVEQTVTHSHEENASEVLLEETVEIPESAVVEERNEEDEETATTVHPTNVEHLGEQVESASNDASENDTLVLELAVGSLGLEEPSLNSGACENESSQDFRETCTVEGQNEEQSQSEESKMHPAAPVEEVIPVPPAAVVDESSSVELVEEKDELETEENKAETEEEAETEESEKEEEEKGKEAEMEKNNPQTVHLPLQTVVQVDERMSAEKAEAEEEEEEAEREKDEEKENAKEEKDEVEDDAAADEEMTLQTVPLQSQEDQEEDHDNDDNIKTNGVTNGCHSSDNSATSSAIEESVEEEVPDSDHILRPCIEEVGKAVSAMATETTAPGNTVESGNAEEHHADEGEPIAEDCCDLKGQNCQGRVTGQPCSDLSPAVLESVQGDPSPRIAFQEPDVSL